MKLGFAALMLLASAAACKSVPPGQLATRSLTIRGNRALGDSEIEERIATVATPKVLGLFRSPWVHYETFDPAVLEQDLARVTRLYQRRGYYDASVVAARTRVQGRHVDVEIVVHEGDRVVVRSLGVGGLSAVAPRLAASARAAVTLAVGRRFDQDELGASAAAVREVLTENGYAYAEVRPAATVDLGPHVADVRFDVDPGPRCVVGEVTFEGLAGLPERILRRTFAVAPGDPYDSEDLEAGRRSILALGVLASARVDADLSDRTRTAVPIHVSTIRSATTGVKLGAGVQLDFTRADAHGVIGWEHRNFLGGLRRLTLEERPSLTLFPTAVPALLPPTRLLPGHRASLSFRQPGFVEARTVGTLQLEQSIYPVIVPPPDPRAEIIVGYREVRGSVGPERTFPLVRLTVSALYDLQANFPFTYVGQLDPSLARFLASYVELASTLDLRDDPIEPHVGFFVSNDFEVAGGIFGGDAADVRLRPEMRMYFPVASRVTLATRAQLGLLFPRNYGATLDDPFPAGRDLQILYFRGFFSGGADSNRGYGFRDLGPHGVAPFYIPGSAAAAAARCQPSSPEFDPRLCSVALGGLSMWQASVELRGPIAGDLGGVVFLDASDVARERLQIRLEYPHLSAGFGIRYATPVGPLRVDLGFRIPGAQRVGGELSPITEGSPGTFFGVPVALAVGLGEAF